MFDWVVAGNGAGSMSSGFLMRQAGKSVVILEKTAFVGGTTPFTEWYHPLGNYDSIKTAIQ